MNKSIMLIRLLLFLSFLVPCFSAFAQKHKKDSFNTFSKIPYEFKASTAVNNPMRSEYEHGTKNQPKKVPKNTTGNGFFIYLDTVNIVRNSDGIICHQLLLINKSDSIMSFNDISIEPEILDSTNHWISIRQDDSYSMVCGTDNYNLYLSPDEHWSFKVPILKGIYKTKLRYRYLYEKEYIDFTTVEIDAYINPQVLGNKYLETANTLSDKDSIHTNYSVISLDKMNVVYRGLVNPLSIAIPGESYEMLVVKASCGKLTPQLNLPGTYHLTFDSAYNDERELLIEVYLINKSGQAILKGQHTYRIRPIPQPTAMLGSIMEDGKMNLGVLKSATFVFLNLADFPFEGIKYTVVEYSLTWKKTTGEIVLFEGKGSKVTNEMRRAFVHASSGDKFILSNIKGNGPGGLSPIKDTLSIEVK